MVTCRPPGPDSRPPASTMERSNAHPAPRTDTDRRPSCPRHRRPRPRGDSRIPASALGRRTHAGRRPRDRRRSAAGVHRSRCCGDRWVGHAARRRRPLRDRHAQRIVGPARPGHGVGEPSLRASRALGFADLWGRTTNDPPDALRFYERRGFRLARIVPGAIDLERSLKPSIRRSGDTAFRCAMRPAW